MPELLPVPLAMPRPTNISSSRRNLDDFDTYDSLQMLLKYLRAKNLEVEQEQSFNSRSQGSLTINLAQNCNCN